MNIDAQPVYCELPTMTKGGRHSCSSGITGTLDITRDMTRQYKGMQEELLNRINQLEGTIQVIVSPRNGYH